MILDVWFPGLGARGSTPAPDDDYWYSAPGVSTAAGIKVTPDTAMQTAAVMACVQVLAETLGSLPLMIYERMGERGKRLARNHPLYELLHEQPNPWQTSQEFREMMQGHLALRGNAYARILPGPRGAVDQLVPLHPDRVLVERLPGGRIGYEVHDWETSRWQRFVASEIFHLRWISLDGLKGISRIELAANTIGLSQSAEKHNSKLYGQGSRPGGVLRTAGKLPPKAKDTLRRDWERMHAGPDGAYRVAVLEHGLEWQAVGLSPEQTQLLEIRKFQVSEIARLFRMPPHMVGDLEKATFSNIEHQDIAFTKHTMLPWCSRWEQAIRRDLVLAPLRFFAEFLLTGLERGDTKARSEFYTKLFNIGVLSINDIRALENLNPVEGGNVHFVPLNMRRLDESGAAAAVGGSNDVSAARAALACLAADVAGRIVRAEVNGLQVRAGHATDDPDRWGDYVLDFYLNKHRAYIRQSLAPLCEAWGRLTGHNLDPGAMAATIANLSARELLAVEDPRDVLAVWRREKTPHLARLILEGFCNDDDEEETGAAAA